MVIRIKDLPLNGSPSPAQFVPTDLSATQRLTIQDVVDTGAPINSQAEAEAGIVNTGRMTPLSTAQAIAAQAATAAQGALADTAVQPGDLAAVATSGDYNDLINLPSLSTELIFPVKADAAAATIPADEGGIRTNGNLTEGDGSGGLYIDVNNGNSDTFVSSGGTARTWYRAPDVSASRLTGAADIRTFLDTAPYVATRTAAKALDTTKDTTLILTEAGREGIFNWKSGDFSAEIAADTAEGIYLKADAIAATSGAWVRVYDELDVRWFGAVGDGTDATAAFSAAIALSTFLERNKIICRDPAKQFKIIELQITNDLEIDLYGGTILGDFGAWGTHSTLGTPIYWTKNVFFSVEADAPSVTLKNLTVNGQNDPNQQMIGGTPMIDFRGAAAQGNCVITFENFTMTRGSNRIYTTGSGISAPTLLLAARNMEILVYNADRVWLNNVELRSSPGEMLQIQSDNTSTQFGINKLYATKARDHDPSSKWSSSALNVLNCHRASEMRNSRFYFFTKGPVNWEMDGGLVESCDFEWVDDSNGLDFNEAGSYRFNGATVRNCTFRDIVNAGIRTSGSNVLFENNSFHNVNICHLIEANIGGDPAKGAWLRTTQVPLDNITIVNPSYLAFNAAHTDKIGIKAIGVSAVIPVKVKIEGGSSVDRPSSGNKPLFGVHGTNAWMSLSGYFGAGTTALVFMTGATGKLRAQDVLFDPEVGESVHTVELNAVTMGKKAVIFDNVTRLTALDVGNFDFRNTGSTLDIDTIHINNSPGFAGTTNNAVISRDGVIEGSATFDPASVAAGASVTTAVTVTGARLAVEDTVKVSPSVNPAGLIVIGAITASNTVTVTYFNPTTGAIDLASHTITAYVTKAAS